MKKIKIHILLLLFISVLINCSKSPPYFEKETTTKQTRISLNEEMIKIPIQNIGFLLNFTPMTVSTNLVNDTLFMALYNYTSNTLELFDLDNYKHIEQISIKKEFTNYTYFDNIPTFVNSTYLHSKDSIFLLTSNGIVLIDGNGKQIEDINLNFNNNIIKKDIYINNANYFPMAYDKKNNGFFLHGTCTKYDLFSNMYYREPFEYFYDLDTGEMDTLPIRYPNIYFEGYFGSRLSPMRISNKNTNIYTFKMDPNIYIYQRRNDSIYVKGGKSKFQLNKIAPLSKRVLKDKEERMRYDVTTPEYGRMIYDEYKNIYYRLYKRGQVLRNEEGTFNSYADKYESLLIFDVNFHKIGEVELDRYKYNSSFSIVTKKGLLISATNSGDKNEELGFYLLKFDIAD